MAAKLTRAQREDKFIVVTKADLDEMQEISLHGVRLTTPRGKAAIMSPQGSVRFCPKAQAKLYVKQLNAAHQREKRSPRDPLTPLFRKVRRQPDKWRKFKYVAIWTKPPTHLSHAVPIRHDGFSSKRKAVAWAKSMVETGKADFVEVYTDIPSDRDVSDGKLVVGFTPEGI